jgi:hypothetical protein
MQNCAKCKCCIKRIIGKISAQSEKAPYCLSVFRFISDLEKCPMATNPIIF